MSLEVALQYNFDDLEIRALKLALLWEKICKLEIPDYRYARMPKGDPRKSMLFRYCRKLAKETYGLLPDDQYKFYILAQIRMLKNLSDGKVHALIEPMCLCGEKAWIRWKIWKSNFEKEARKLSNRGTVDDIKIINTKVVSELKRTRNFLEANFGKDYTEKHIKTAYAKNDLIKWFSFSKISPFYVILSIVSDLCPNIESTFSFDVGFYKNSIDDNARAAFNKLFPNRY